MDDSVKNFYVIQSPDDYERSHAPRFDFLVKDLKLDQLKNSRVGDFGCGLGNLISRLPQNAGNEYYGFDGADIAGKSKWEGLFRYFQVDLCTSFADAVFQEFGNDFRLDIALCCETFEHLENPYRCLFEIKRLLRQRDVLVISIPAESCAHNTFYPGLLYPRDNFMEFLCQMAFSVELVKRHDKAFSQNVFVCRNADWTQSRMKFPKAENKFQGQPPHIVVNL